MKQLPANSVDAIICDLPYGMTACAWDSVIPFDKLWREYRRIIKPKGNCVLFGNQPFTTTMINSNRYEYSHVWYWKKNSATGHFTVKKQPLRIIEDVVVFVLKQSDNSGSFQKLREYMFEEREKTGLTPKELRGILGNTMTSHYWTWGQQFVLPSKQDYAKLQAATGCFQRPLDDLKREWREEVRSREANTATYNPQGVAVCNITCKNDKKSNVYRKAIKETYVQTQTGYPKNILEFSKPNSFERVHPTQKPVDLLEYLIRTYTNEGDTVLDNCMGSGSTGVACVNTGRRFIGMELDAGYFEIAEKRIDEARGLSVRENL